MESIGPIDKNNKKEYSSNIILVLDLDETLWWTPRSAEEHSEFLRQHGLEQNQTVGVEQGILPVRYGDFSFDMPYRLRPGVLDFLKATVLTEKYETHIFTRAESGCTVAIDALAKAVVESAGDTTGVDPTSLFAGRHFADECKDYLGLGMWYCKPLEPLVRASRGEAIAEDDLLKRVVIVDDRSDSYYPCNRYNGIPVRTFLGIRGESDAKKMGDEVEYAEDGSTTFERLAELLESLEPMDDVRPVLKAVFKDANRKYL
ncbi:MAG: hypothetical protein SGILL_009804 [Bacillariaceae sp.]